MKLRNRIRSVLWNLIANNRTRRFRGWIFETRRRLFGRPHVVSVFLQIDDPYSYLLTHYLRALETHYPVVVRYYLSQARAEDYQPDTEKLAEYAVSDCARVASELGIPFLDKGTSPPAEFRVALTDTIAAALGNENFAEELLGALSAYWRGDSEAVARRVAATSHNGEALIERSQRVQQRLGHYASAMLHYAGEWYWGVDRLHRLMARLDSVAAAKQSGRSSALTSIVQVMQVDLPVRPPAAARDLPDVELFYSLRSPYSFIALQRIVDVCEAFGIGLKLRPVLPMVTRGMRVPKLKLRYIAHDARSEAERYDVPIGKFADPLGVGVERGLAVLAYAKTEQRDIVFLQELGQAVWGTGIDIATDRGMRKVTNRVGLDWPNVRAAMRDDAWQESVEENAKALNAAGCWGVPTIRIGDYVVWGQDRIWLLVRHLEDLCDTGDGILI